MTNEEKLEALKEVVKKLEGTIKSINSDPYNKFTVWVEWDKVLADVEKIVND